MDPDPYSIRTQELSESTLGWVKNSIKPFTEIVGKKTKKKFFVRKWLANLHGF